LPALPKKATRHDKGGADMTRQVFWKVLVLCLILAFAGCAGTPKEKAYSSSPKVRKVSNASFDAEIEPLLAKDHGYYDVFLFSFTNKTGGDMFIDWDNTFYLLNGRKNGLFGWEGMDWKAIDKVKKQPLVKVPAGITHTVEVFPLKLAGRDPRMASTMQRYTRGMIPAGENGILLTVRMGEKTLQETMNVMIK